MQTNIIRLILIITLLLPFHLLTAQDKKQDDISIIKSLRTASNVAIAKHDVDGIAKYWLDDFVQIRGNASSLTGKDTIAASWKEMFKTKPDVGYVRNTTEIIINANGIMAWETGNWIGINSYSKGGNYSAMWRKMDGVWKLQAELFVALK